MTIKTGSPAPGPRRCQDAFKRSLTEIRGKGVSRSTKLFVWQGFEVKEGVQGCHRLFARVDIALSP